MTDYTKKSELYLVYSSDFLFATALAVKITPTEDFNDPCRLLAKPIYLRFAFLKFFISLGGRWDVLYTF